MTIQQKYSLVRNHLQTGDIVLFRGKALISKIIEKVDDAYYSHSGIVFIAYSRVFIIDSTGRGVNVDFLSTRVNEEVDFSILRPKKDWAQIVTAISKALQIGDEHYKYNYWMLLQILIYKWFGKDFTHLTSRHSFICSKFVQYYTDCLGIKCYKRNYLITPQDFLRLLNGNEIKIFLK